jgi:hypothetical protein
MDGQVDVATAIRRLAASRAWVRQGAALTLGSLILAAAAQPLAPSLAGPLLLAGLIEASIVYFVASGRRRLTAELAVERDYYAIPEVRSYGEKLKAPRARERLADWLVELIEVGTDPENAYLGDRIADNRSDLLAVADDLRSPRLEAHPTTLATCVALLTRGASSPLYNRGIPPDALRAVLLRIRLGFHERTPDGR